MCFCVKLDAISYQKNDFYRLYAHKFHPSSSTFENLYSFNALVTGSFLWTDFVKKCNEANAQKRVAKICPVDMLVRRSLRLHQYFDLLPMMRPHQQGITLYGQYLLVRQYDQVQSFPQVDL
jgi:hypothetical protein